jgi:hypothetical protein
MFVRRVTSTIRGFVRKSRPCFGPSSERVRFDEVNPPGSLRQLLQRRGASSTNSRWAASGYAEVVAGGTTSPLAPARFPSGLRGVKPGLRASATHDGLIVSISGSWLPQPHRTPIVADFHPVAVVHSRPQDEPQALDVRRQLDGGADDLAGMGVWTDARIIVAHAELLALPGDDERVGAFTSRG